MAESSDLPAKIRALLKHTTDLIDICYDGRSGLRDILVDDPFDFEQTSDQLVELRDVLEKLFKAATTNGTNSPRVGLSIDEVNGMLKMCSNEISEVETALKQESDQEKIKGPSSSLNLQVTLTGLVSSTTALRGALETNQRSAWTGTGNSVVPPNQKFIDSRHSTIYNVQGDMYNFSSEDTDHTREKLCTWLAAPDPSSNQNDTIKKRGPETGLWFIGGSLFKDWKTGVHSFAWIHGIPGCGKSVLCSTIIQDIGIYCKKKSGFALAYFYFDFTDPNKQKSSSLIRSFLTQLSFQLPVCPDFLVKLRAQHQNGSQQASTADLMDALKSMIGYFHHAYFVIDALDECLDQDDLLSALTEIADWKLHNLHVLATSRRQRNIEENLTQIVSSHTGLDSDIVDEDIRCYLSATFAKDIRFRIWTAAECQETKETLMLRAHGMFRWVTCQLDVLAKCSSLHKLRRALQSLPATLEETYDRILLCICKESRGDALKLLQWLAFSARPITLAEMAEIFAIDREETAPRFDPDQRPRNPRAILDICSSLLTVSYNISHEDAYEHRLFRLPASVRESGILSLAHLSVKEYLVSERVRNSSLSYYHLDKKLATSAISRECLAYILHFDTVGCLDNQSEASISFGRYAAKFWIVHARSDDYLIQSDVGPLVAKLFSSNSANFTNWIKLFNADPPSGLVGFPKSAPHPLYYASLLGLCQIVDLLVLRSDLEYVNLKEGYYGSALASASFNGHLEVVQILIEKGADVNIFGGHYESALASASAAGHIEIVQLLLECGAYVNIAGGWWRTALGYASACGHLEVVQILLEQGADVNMVGRFHGGPLASAAEIGHAQIVQILLDKGAKVNIVEGRYGTALGSASYSGSKKVVQILLENGAEVNITGGHVNGNALVLASAEGHEEIVQILLESGADVNGVGGCDDPSGCTSPLGWASTRGHLGIAQILLDWGADVNLKHQDGRSILRCASERSQHGIVQLLLEHGANFDEIANNDAANTVE